MAKKLLPKLLLSFGVLLSSTTHAVVNDQQWGDWYGNISAMEFEINANNDTGEQITLTCIHGGLIVAYSVPAKDYRVSSDTGLKEPGLNINAVHYQLGEAAFMALKNASNEGQVEITETNKPLSKIFKTAGLKDALKEVTWLDCISQ